MKRFSVLMILLVLLLSGCSRQEKEEIRIAINPWIGYSPLYYASQMGWLKSENIELVATTSLQESVQLFQAGLIDAFGGTQYEASQVELSRLAHLMTLDRSNGGDVVLANRPLPDVIESEDINAYLEVDSVNSILLEEVIRLHRIARHKINLINRDQSRIEAMSPATDEIQLLVTYEPYATSLRNKGFHEIGSTRNVDILVMDSVYVCNKMFSNNRDQFYRLTEIVERAYAVLKDSPEQYFNTVNDFLEYGSYEEFMESLGLITWTFEMHKDDISEQISEHDLLPLVKGN